MQRSHLSDEKRKMLLPAIDSMFKWRSSEPHRSEEFFNFQSLLLRLYYKTIISHRAFVIRAVNLDLSTYFMLSLYNLSRAHSTQTWMPVRNRRIFEFWMQAKSLKQSREIRRCSFRSFAKMRVREGWEVFRWGELLGAFSLARLVKVSRGLLQSSILIGNDERSPSRKFENDFCPAENFTRK